MDHRGAAGSAGGFETTEATRLSAVEPIAVIGLACRFPGADDVEQFWRNLVVGGGGGGVPPPGPPRGGPRPPGGRAPPAEFWGGARQTDPGP
ncbi:beta-ketoacyl synthase N-terminal-like domain-containing protein, partial [Actinosynnema sp. NPDC000082]|uniref:beta-ketoacyl synthase N-terminal-like domain-containing protein n=1 Tax=Actinosynnema sp. NPDC000082 TaxID=3363910 RepID=UPI0036AEB8C6